MSTNTKEVTRTTLRSDELSCPSCIAKIEKALLAVDGVERARVRFNSGRIDVEHDAAKVPASRLVEVVRSAGYDSRVSAF